MSKNGRFSLEVAKDQNLAQCGRQFAVIFFLNIANV